MRPILPLQLLPSSPLSSFFFVFAAEVHVPCPIRLQFKRGQAGTGPRERREEAEE